MMYRLLPLLLAGSLLGDRPLFGATPDLSTPPDPAALASVYRSGGLAAFRVSLGDALAAGWSPSSGGAGGACSRESFGRWVDLYQWIDLLDSDEAAVTRRWLARHLSMKGETTPSGQNVQVTIHQPGTPLVRRYDALHHRVTEQVASDPAMLARVTGELVAQPFSSRNGPLLGRLDPQFVEATITDPSFLKAWGNAVTEDDFAPKVLLNLQAIWKAWSREWREFPDLAIAVALVHDQPAPVWWPHRQVLQKDVPRIAPDPANLFGRIVRASREGRLKRDLQKLDAEELKYVVDAPLSPSEFAGIRDSASLSREDPARAFAAITYDHGRVTRGAYVWPWGTYSLAQIRKKGGICVDQAYYSAMSGKALGIPTIFFAGLGKEGGHAWTGYLRGKDSWYLDVGRSGGGNCATGEALDPQNWTPITDHDIEMLKIHARSRAESDAARRDLAMALNFRRRNDATGEGAAIQSALSRSPNNSLLWDAKEDWLVRTGSSPAEIKDHHRNAIKQFARYRDLKTQHEEALARISAESGDKNAAQQISKKIVKENQGVRSDLSAEAAMRLIRERMDANDVKGALNEYARQLSIQGAAGGGNFFYRVTGPFASLLLSKGRPDLARRVLIAGYNTIKPAPGSLVEKDLQKLWLEAGGKR